MDRSFLTENPKLVDEIVCEVKSQGVFDQFRRNCIADVDTKPAYQNLRQRVENIVSNFLNEQTWRPDLNKNQLREKLRKHITEAGFLETGVERIVDQVVNPKINSVFLPKIEDISYKYLGIEKPKPSEEPLVTAEPPADEETKAKDLSTDLDDLEAVSPDSTASKKSFKDSIENLKTAIDLEKSELNDSGEKVDDDFESPAFEPLKSSLLAGSDSVNGEEDSKLSDISGLTSQDSVNSEQRAEIEVPVVAIKAPTIEVVEPAVTQSQQVIPENINQDSVLSQVSSNSHLSIVTDSNNKSSEVDICEEAQMPKFSENSFNNLDVDEKERKPLLTSFDIKQDEIIFEGTERRSSLHDLNDDNKIDEDVVMEEIKDSVRTDLVGDESLNKTESSSSLDPIIGETKDLSLKDECRSNEGEFKFEEPHVSVDTTDVSICGSSQNLQDKNRSKGERKSNSKLEHKSHRRDKEKYSHHSRDRHKDGERKHSSSSSSKHSSTSSSSRKEHRSESRDVKKSSSSEHRRDDSSKSTKSQSSSHSSNRDKDSNHKSSRHDDKHDKSFRDSSDKDRNRSKHDRSSNKSRRDDKSKSRTHDDDGKKKSGQESLSKSKSIDDDHASHHDKPMERRRSTDRDSDDGSADRGSGRPTSSTNQQTDSGSVNAIANSTSSSSFSSTTSSCTDDHEKRERGAADYNVETTSPDDGFVPLSAPVLVDQFLVGNKIDLDMLMEATSTPSDEIELMSHQSLPDENELKIKKPKVASNIYEARKLMKVRKQMEREEKKRLGKLLVHSKPMITNSANEQGVELEFSIMHSSAPSISSPVKAKDVHFDVPQTPAAVVEKRNSGEFIIDLKEMEQVKKKKPEKPVIKYAHKFDEILSQIDRPRKRDSKGNMSPISPTYDKSPKFEPVQRKYVREQSKEAPTAKAPTTMTSPPTHQRVEKKTHEKSLGRPQPIKDPIPTKSSLTQSSPPKIEPRISKSNKTVDKTMKPSAASSATASAPVEKRSSSKHSKQKKIELVEATETTSSKEIVTTSSKEIVTTSSKEIVTTSSKEYASSSPKQDDVTLTKQDDTKSLDLDKERKDGFFGFTSTMKSSYDCVLDYIKVQQILQAKSKDQTLHVIGCDDIVCDFFSRHSSSVFQIKANENCLTEVKRRVSKAASKSFPQDPKNNASSKNGVRTASSQSQHKLFIENNQFSDSTEVKQITRKREANRGAQGSAAKIARLADNKKSAQADEIVEASPTPSEQSKENQIIRQKKHNRASETFTSNELDQHGGEKSESINKANQRYTSDDLYKPRPILSRSRRRGIENGEI
ncbi:Biorientation of chromosomes in cell division protein 1 [Pseudolycoriella hygida]|uniref:Biorientation of chromosomes in cell division protein 1 n=1 Tax=Pseudolycoriella hygida TaxID=35572 RepID=A0A9Q0MXZ6_9DIPT|nr:Biorientation of chromosomes in cell division protein 1 [Pseudolycoriella hygida]